MKKAILYLFWATTAAAVGKTTVKEFRGKAYHLKTGKLIYIEHHKEHYRKGRHLYSDIYYRHTTGEAFAYKRITFARSKTAPNFKLTDYRSGYVEGATYEKGKAKLFVRRYKNKEYKIDQIAVKRNTVIDGGFDYYVRKNWNKLLTGKKYIIRFAVAAQTNDFKFQIFKLRQDAETVTFRLRIHSIFLRLFAENVDITYAKKERVLKIYRGISNINNNKGKSWRVQIVF